MPKRQIISLDDRNKRRLIEYGKVTESSDGRLYGISDVTNYALEDYLDRLKKQKMRF